MLVNKWTQAGVAASDQMRAAELSPHALMGSLQEGGGHNAEGLSEEAWKPGAC